LQAAGAKDHAECRHAHFIGPRNKTFTICHYCRSQYLKRNDDNGLRNAARFDPKREQGFRTR
jgi:hypothetical protein